MIDLIKIVSGFLVEILILFFVYLGLNSGGSVKVFLKCLAPQIIGASIIFVGTRKGLVWLVYLGNILIITDVAYITASSLLSQIRKDLPSTINKVFLIVLAPLQAMIRLNTIIIWFAIISLISQKYFGVYIMIFFVLDSILLATLSIVKIIVNDMKYLKLKISKKDTIFYQIAMKISYIFAFVMLIIFMGYAFWGFVNILIR